MSSATCSVMASTKPVFFLRRELPPISNSNERCVTLEICLAAERVCGSETILGALDIGGLWRVYPLSGQARNQLLLEGLCLRGHRVQVYDQNPFILQGPGEIQSREVVLDPQVTGSRRDQEQGGGARPSN